MFPKRACCKGLGGSDSRARPGLVVRLGLMFLACTVEGRSVKGKGWYAELVSGELAVVGGVVGVQCSTAEAAGGGVAVDPAAEDGGDDAAYGSVSDCAWGGVVIEDARIKR